MRKQEFKDYLKSRGYKDDTISNYLTYCSQAEKFLQDEHVFNDIDDFITNNEEYLYAQNVLYCSNIAIRANMQCVLKHYYEFANGISV